MKDESASPEIYWIVGDGTNVGKTTVACALIRTLNKAGRPTAGFKPYAAMMLLENFARMAEDVATSPWRLYGEDALNLVKASPLTSPEMVDVVGPSQFLCHSRWPSALMARTGSIALKNVEYFKSAEAIPLEEGLDDGALIEKTGLPLGDAKPLGTLNFLGAASLSPEKQKLAFDYLVQLGAASIVCEGPGKFIPNWQDCPGVNHVISIAKGRVAFFPNADLRVTFSRDGSLTPASALAGYLDRSRKPRYDAQLRYVAEHKHQEEAAERIVTELLTISGRSAVVN